MDWYKVENAVGNRLDVYIYDRIGEGIFMSGLSAKKFITDLNKNPEADIYLHINSPGGSVFDGFAIYNYLLGRNVKNVYIEGLAASIATIIALSGDQVSMANNSLFMIHNPVSSVSGDSHKLRKRVKILDKIKEQIIAVYEQNSSMERAEIESLMNAETWLTAQESKEKGFVDEITGAVKIAAEYDLSIFDHIPDNFFHKSKKNKGGLMNELLKTLGVDNEAAAIIKINDLLQQSQDSGNLRNEITGLKVKLAAANKKTVENTVAEAIKNGKLLPAQKEWAMALAEKEPELFGKYIENSENFLKKDTLADKTGEGDDGYGAEFIPGGEK